MKKILALTVLMLAYCGGSKQVKNNNAASDGWTVATGVAAIQNNEIGRAKDDALEDAKLSAVKQELGVLIKGRTEVDSGVFQSSELIAKAEGFIEKYDVLSQKAISKYEYQVKIKAKVSKAKLESVLEDLINRQGRPRMMAIINETIQGKKSLSSGNVAATQIESNFTSKGFPFVDPATVKKILKKQRKKIRKALGGDNDTLQELGVDAGAEVVLVGYSKVSSAGKVLNSKLNSMQADVSVRVIDVNTGQIIAAHQEHGAYPHINEYSGAVGAIKKAVKKLSDKTINDISRKWKRGKTNTIELLVVGLDYGQIKKLRSEMLEQVRGVKAINRKGNVGKAAKLQVEFLGKSFTLADRIVDAKLSYKLKVGEVKPGSIDLTAR